MIKKQESKEKELTKAEEQIMHIIWKIEKGFVNDIMKSLPEPKPAYNTVSTIVRILEKKGFVNHKAYGKTHEYFPVVTKKSYTKSYIRSFVGNYFGSSFKQLVSFFTQENNLSLDELEEIKKLMDEEIKKKKGD
jgi:BlaI family transcriptional regulator, penicillinase repressor